MKFSSIEEYGLRCLLQIGKNREGLTIPEISQLERLTVHNVGKIMRLLRLGGFVESSRGKIGGYRLATAPERIIIRDVLAALGGKLFESSFCDNHSGTEDICTNSIDCSIRSVWKAVQVAIDDVLSKITLKDLLYSENEINQMINQLNSNKKYQIKIPGIS